MAKIEAGNIANVERIKITTEETTPKTYVFETATSASFTAVSDEGTENTLRIKNTIHGLIKTDTLVKGYDIEFSDQTLILEIMALIDGGSYTGTLDTAGESYEGPVAGSAVTRKPFTLTLYTSDRDTDGSAVAYHQWEFPTCKGTPISGSFSDGEFATNAYKCESRPAKGENTISVERIASLPAVT